LEINKLIFTFKVQEFEKESVPEFPENGVYIYGLILEGTKWDKKKKSLVE